MNVLCLSPHLDDAALSCGGTLHALARAGADVTVATVFSECRDAATRQWEDRQALARLGARPVHLGLRDAPVRWTHLRSFHSIVFLPHPQEEEDRAEVKAALRALLHAGAPSGPFRRLLCPLGVGRHVDHRVVCAAVRGLANEDALLGAHLSFYEDRPYAFVPGAVAARLRELEPPDLGWAQETLPFLGRYMADAEDRARSLLALRGYLVPPPRALRRRALRLCPDAILRRDAALCCYRSQLEDLFGGDPRPVYARCHGDEEALWTQAC